MDTKKKIVSIKAGEVIAMKYKGEGRPCDYGIGILITPIKQEDGASGTVRTVYAMNAETWEPFPNGESYSTGMDVMVVKGKQKAQYFEKLVEYTKGK